MAVRLETSSGNCGHPAKQGAVKRSARIVIAHRMACPLNDTWRNTDEFSIVISLVNQQVFISKVAHRDGDWRIVIPHAVTWTHHLPFVLFE
jgi:hypothetical protein